MRPLQGTPARSPAASSEYTMASHRHRPAVYSFARSLEVAAPISARSISSL